MIPVAAPDVGPLEEQYVLQAVRSGWVSSLGEFVDRFERDFAAYCETEHGVGMTNGTDALFIALRALGIGPGDEVIVPALTFVAVPAVVAHLGARPVLVDVHPEHWCLDPAAVERAITKQTKAIVAVHVYGHPADMDRLLEIARSRGIYVVEDCAEAHGARYRGKRVGSIGDVGCFSFYGNKIITTGEGGMAVTNDAALATRMRFLKDHAMDPKRRYFHPEVGFNCRMTNLQAALGCAQLERIDELQSKRMQILDGYRRALEGIDAVRLNPAMPWAEPVSWMVCAVLDESSRLEREHLASELRAQGIDSRPFFVPAQVMPPYASCRTVSAQGEGTPVSDRLSRTGLNLPSGTSLDAETVNRIGSAVKALVNGV